MAGEPSRSAKSRAAVNKAYQGGLLGVFGALDNAAREEVAAAQANAQAAEQPAAALVPEVPPPRAGQKKLRRLMSFAVLPATLFRTSTLQQYGLCNHDRS